MIIHETTFTDVPNVSDLCIGVHPVQGWIILNQHRGGGEWSDVVLSDEQEVDAVLLALLRAKLEMRKVQR